ncbi:Protein CBG07288 [Caenorhabditis briggsae]|uniref:Protein CBG07288 n=1 Tax=Caenorhabditis briggsae TaxID=6238 RepID=A8X527_CAEBR|nr:Protein CBG07288 [Caenorhabditis briggsae]CAP27738.1 Protein CBG07288 [Caenorhabditis briggsae]
MGSKNGKHLDPIAPKAEPESETIGSSASVCAAPDTNSSSDFSIESSDKPLYSDIHFGEGRFNMINVIGRGGYGIVVLAEDVKTKKRYALKIGKPGSASRRELAAFKLVNGTKGVPVLIQEWRELGCVIMQMQLVGMSLNEFVKQKGRKLTLAEGFKLAPMLIDLVEAVHSKGIIHADVKPTNFAFGLGSKASKLYILDFGLSVTYLTSSGKHMEETYREANGTPYYMSANQHMSLWNSRRDDLESVVFTLMELCDIDRRWKHMAYPNYHSDHMVYWNAKLGGTDGGTICQVPQFNSMLKMCRTLKYKDKPDYEGMKRLFKMKSSKANRAQIKPISSAAVVKHSSNIWDKNVIMRFHKDRTEEDKEMYRGKKNKEESDTD